MDFLGIWWGFAGALGRGFLRSPWEFKRAKKKTRSCSFLWSSSMGFELCGSMEGAIPNALTNGFLVAEKERCYELSTVEVLKMNPTK